MEVVRLRAHSWSLMSGRDGPEDQSDIILSGHCLSEPSRGAVGKGPPTRTTSVTRVVLAKPPLQKSTRMIGTSRKQRNQSKERQLPHPQLRQRGRVIRSSVFENGLLLYGFRIIVACACSKHILFAQCRNGTDEVDSTPLHCRRWCSTVIAVDYLNPQSAIDRRTQRCSCRMCVKYPDKAFAISLIRFVSYPIS